MFIYTSRITLIEIRVAAVQQTVVLQNVGQETSVRSMICQICKQVRVVNIAVYRREEV